VSLRGALSDEAISFSGKDCFAPLAMTRLVKERFLIEDQILGALLVLQGILTVAGLLIAKQIHRESRDSADKSREVEQLVSASLEVAREILRNVKK
jgi:hypothetical protein